MGVPNFLRCQISCDTNILPCGTPEITGNGGKITPSSLTDWGERASSEVVLAQANCPIPGKPVNLRVSLK